MKNILSNFIPHETIVCDDRDLPWINSKIKNLIKEKNIRKMFHLQNNSGIQLFTRFQGLHNLLTVTIEKSKQEFFSRISNKSIDPVKSPKAYRSILKMFLNNEKNIALLSIILIILKKQITVFLRSPLLKMKLWKSWS